MYVVRSTLVCWRVRKSAVVLGYTSGAVVNVIIDPGLDQHPSTLVVELPWNPFDVKL